MRSSDITVQESRITFDPIALSPPLVFSGGAIDRFTVAEVRLAVTDRAGRSATGHGATVLSVPWSWPRSDLPVGTRDAVLRDLCGRIADTVIRQPAADPINLWQDLTGSLPELARQSSQAAGITDEIPRLAALLCLGAVDNALHDAWARTAGKSAYFMYTGEYLTDDLGSMIEPALRGHHPGHFLGPVRELLPVQHLVSATDPLTSAGRNDDPKSLIDWVRAERIRHFKLKLLGRDPRADADRVGAVFATLAGTEGLSLAIDPNEGYESPTSVDELLGTLRRHHPAAAAAITYVEQPVPRTMTLESRRPDAENADIPVLMDEGSTSVESLRTLRAAGWDGVVIKAAKGQTYALLAHSFARFNQLFVTVQDLTAVDLAFRHSARLASIFRLSAHHLEYNSRQYAPRANDRLARSHPELATVRDGSVRIGNARAAGIY